MSLGVYHKHRLADLTSACRRKCNETAEIRLRGTAGVRNEAKETNTFCKRMNSTGKYYCEDNLQTLHNKLFHVSIHYAQGICECLFH